MYVIRVYKRSHIPLFFMLPDASTSASLLNNKDMQLKQLGTISSAACRLWLVCLLGMGLAEAAYTDQQNRAMCALWCATDIGMSLDWSCSSCTSPSKPVCDWSRVSCNSAGNITDIDLVPSLNSVSEETTELSFEFSITGSIPTSIGLLQSLNRFDASFNAFHGSIPSTIGLLTGLVHLALNRNLLTGSIPTAIGEMMSLQHLSVVSNQISGALPSSVERLTSLTSLVCSSNHFNGPLPDFAALISLEYLDISSNEFVGPLTFMNHPTLKFVNAGSNYLSSFPFTANPNITFPLKVLNIEMNLIQSIPKMLSDNQQYKLETIILSGINMTLAGLPDFNETTSLRSFECKACQLETWPSFLSLMTQIESIDLSNNKFLGPIPAFLASMMNLNSLHLSNTMLTGTIPDFFGRLQNLNTLAIGGNSLTGDVPIALCNNTGLRFLDISKNPSLGCYYSCIAATELVTDSDHCASAQDEAICDIATALGVSAAIAQKASKNSLVVFQSEHPRVHGTPSAEQHTLNIEDRNIIQIAISFDPLTDLSTERVTVCNNAACSIVYGEYSGVMAPFPGLSGVPALVIIGNSVHITVDALSDLTSSRWGFRMDVEVSYKASGWSCETLMDGSQYATGLCDSWTGVTCEYSTHITKIDLSGLDLVGTIPSSIFMFSKLEHLDLSCNSLSGTLPSKLLALSLLSVLDVASNRLSGPVPPVPASTARGMTSLSRLVLSNNFFSGTLPSFPLQIPFLQALSLQGNRFEGSMDPHYCDLNDAHITVSLYSNPDLCFEPCWTELHPRDQSRCASNNDSSELSILLIVVISVSGLIAIMLLAAMYIFRSPYDKVGSVEDVERERRLRELPVHLAVLSGANEAEVHAAALKSLSTAKERDYDGLTACDLILRNKSALRNVSVETMFLLVSDSLPFDPMTGADIKDPAVHVYAWPGLVGTSEEKWIKVVAMVLKHYKKHIECLVKACDAQGRRSIDIATPACRDMMIIVRRLFERYELQPGPPLHISSTCCLRLAIDHGGGGASPSTNVALKFMRCKASFDQEVRTRTHCDFNTDFVIKFFDNYDGDGMAMKDKLFRDDAILKGFVNYPYCIVMEAADTTLASLISHQNISGNDWDEITRTIKQLLSAVQHVHRKNAIHGDLKPDNIAFVNGHLKLLDFDSAVNDGDYCLSRISTAFAPPERLHSASGNERATFHQHAPQDYMHLESQSTAISKIDTQDSVIKIVPAAYSMDMWSIGAVLYQLCTGCPLFLATVEDNIFDEEDLTLLHNWTPATKAKKLSRVKNAIARNLISMLLTKDPARRPDCSRALAHPFFTGRTPTRMTDGEKAKFDVFISYRVASDQALANLLYQQLMQRELTVWMDMHCLPPGMNWEEGFCKGLVDSAYTICIISREAINSTTDAQRCLSKLGPSSPCDHLLLEWRLALELQERGLLSGIFPILVGDPIDSPSEQDFGDYFKMGCLPHFHNETVVNAVESKLCSHLEREGLGLPYKESLSVKAVVDSVLSNQGAFIRGNFQTALTNIIDKIDIMHRNYRGIQSAVDHGNGSRGENIYSKALSAAEYVQMLQRKDTENSALLDKLNKLEAYVNGLKTDNRNEEEFNKLLLSEKRGKLAPIHR